MVFPSRVALRRELRHLIDDIDIVTPGFRRAPLASFSPEGAVREGKFSGPTRFLNALYGGHRPPEFVGALTEREVDEDVVAVDALVHSSASRRRRAGDVDVDGDGEEVRARERRLKRNEALRVYRRKKALAMREAKARSDEAKKTRSDEPTNASDSEPAPTASGSDDTPDDDYLIETPDSGTS